MNNWGAMTPPDGPSIDRSSVVPVYQQLMDWMVQNISTGTWGEGQQLPSEPLLAEELGVSRGTLRKAIGILIQRGLVVQTHGKGTFVAAAVIDQPLVSQLTSVSEEFIRSGTPFHTSVVGQRLLPAQPRPAAALGLEPGAPVLMLERIRGVDGQPLLFNESYLSGERYGELVDTDFRQVRLFEVLESRYGLTLARAARTISAITASSRIAKALDVAVGAPILYSEQTVYSGDDEAVEFSKAWFRGDRFRLSSEVFRGAGDPVHTVTLPSEWSGVSER